MDLGVACPCGVLLDDPDLRDVNLVGRDLTGVSLTAGKPRMEL